MKKMNAVDVKSTKVKRATRNFSRSAVASFAGALLIVTSLISQPAQAAIIHYDGTCDLGSAGSPVGRSEQNPYLINNVEELWETIDCSAGADPDAEARFFRLTDNIVVPSADLGVASTATYARPIGWAADGNHLTFRGNFDGNGYKITADLDTSSNGVGVFQQVEYSSFRNLNLAGSFRSASSGAGALAAKSLSSISLENVTNTGSVNSTRFVGGIIGSVAGKLDAVRVTNSGNITGTSSNVGGIVGAVQGDLAGESLSNSGVIQGRASVGGIAGYVLNDALLSNSFNAASVTSQESYVGGLIGTVDDGGVELYRVYNTGEIEGRFTYVGGLIGEIEEGALAVREAFNTGGVISRDSSFVGGLIGKAEGFNTFNRLVSRFESLDAMWSGDLYNSGSISGKNEAIGGLFGLLRQLGHWSNAYNTGTVVSTSGSHLVDGLIGNSFDTDEPPRGFSTSPTVYASSTTFTREEMRQADFYIEQNYDFDNWNFDSVWGFGPCDLNDGLPVLRFAMEADSYSSQACGVGTTAAAPAYDGPTLIANELPVSAGETVKLPGTKLGSVSKVLVAGAEAVLVSKGESFIEITIPVVIGGVVDLAVDSDWGRLTVQSALRVSVAEQAFADGAFNAWTKYFSDNTVRIYARNVVGVGKLQYFHNGREIAWIRAAGADEAKLNIRSDGFLRWVELVPGRNVFEIYLDGVRIERRIATVR